MKIDHTFVSGNIAVVETTQTSTAFLYGNNNPNIRNCLQIGRLVLNEPDIEMAIADEIQNFKEYGVPQMRSSTSI